MLSAVLDPKDKRRKGKQGSNSASPSGKPSHAPIGSLKPGGNLPDEGGRTPRGMMSPPNETDEDYVELFTGSKPQLEAGGFDGLDDLVGNQQKEQKLKVSIK